MNVKDNELIDALVNRISVQSDIYKGNNQITVSDEINNVKIRQGEIETQLKTIVDDVEVLMEHEVVIELENLKQQRKRLKASLTRCQKRETTLKITHNDNVQNSVKSVEFLNRLRIEKTLGLPHNAIACYISAHAVLRYIQRYGCDLPYLVLTDIVEVLLSTVKVKLKPEFSLSELLNHNCVSADFYRSNDDIQIIFVVVNGVVITTFNDERNRFEEV